jgi:MFS transporter, DHA1 family, multidrug resistance protein
MAFASCVCPFKELPMLPPLFRTALVLGLLTAMGPFAIDMYLPALPVIGTSLGANDDMVQASLMAFLIALGAGQLISGPLSDMFGRKTPLYIGLTIFIVASIGCALSPTINVLIALRVFQGLGACAVMVIPRAVVRDLYSGPDAARLMSLLMTIYSVSPILAPLLGSGITHMVGWRGVFWAIGLLAAIGVWLVAMLLPETRLPAARQQASLGAALSGYRTLLGDSHFVAMALIASLTLGGFFIYVANSSFVMSQHFGVSPSSYAILFALNAVSFVVMSQLNGRLAARFGLKPVVRIAIVCHVVTMLLLFALTVVGVDRLDVLVALLFVGYGLNGIIVPSTFVIAMQENPTLAGTASALIGTLNFAGGAIVVALVAPFADGTPLPMVTGIAASSVAVFVIAMVTLAPKRTAATT